MTFTAASGSIESILGPKNLGVTHSKSGRRQGAVIEIPRKRWADLQSVEALGGAFTLTAPGATQVELLADRRPLFTPDFEGDSVVDASDCAFRAPRSWQFRSLTR